jgi:signal transduction histidine kinase
MSDINPIPQKGNWDINKGDILAVCCLVAITVINPILPARIRVDTLYVCCVLLVAGQSIRKIIIYSLIACCLILLTHLGMNRTLPLSWVDFANAGVSITAALITGYFANTILKKNKLLAHSNAEGTRDLAEINHTLDESQSHLRTIFKTTDIAFLLLDSKLQILTWNAIADQWAEQSFGAPLREGTFFWDFLNEERKEPVKELMHTAMSDPLSYEICYLMQSGAPQWYRIGMNPVKDRHDKSIGLCCSAVNITSAKLIEIKNIRITNDLLQRNRDLEQFSYIVSHNLRAPVANILGLAQILKQNRPEQHERIDIENFLFEAVLMLDEIVKDLNLILQIRREIKEKKEKVVFSELLGEVLIVFHPVIEQENIIVLSDFSEAREIFSIKSYLYGIFFNLVSNSIKYRRPGITTIIDIRSWQENNKILIRFKDNGRGINLDGKGHEVFGLYKRFHLDVEGKGMGLFMVSSQVKILGGDIDVQSELGVGTAFFIGLPKDHNDGL